MPILIKLFLPTLVSCVTFTLIYLHVPTRDNQRIIAVLLLILLLLFSRYIYKNPEGTLNTIIKSLFVFISALLVQLLIITSGGVYSPFLILIYIFTLGLGFLLDLVTSITFLITTILILILQIYFDPLSNELFLSDPWTAILYFTSFIVIIPISYLLTSSYRLKDSLSKILKDSLTVGQAREESILSGLNDLVLITDTSLKILYVNFAAEKELGKINAELINQPIFSILSIVDANGVQSSADNLPIAQTLIDKTARILQHYYLFGKNKIKRKINLQIKPIADSKGKILQIVFVINQPNNQNSSQVHSNLEQAHQKYLELLEQLRTELPVDTAHSSRTKVELIGKVAEDLWIAQEIEDHPLKERIFFQDVALVCKQIIATKQNLAQSLMVTLNLLLPETETEEAAYLNLASTNPLVTKAINSPFMAPIDYRWFDVLIQKLIDLSLLISSQNSGSQVKVIIYQKDSSTLNIDIQFTCTPLTVEEQKDLFSLNYGNLSNKIHQLNQGSGLEGYIAKFIADHLNIPLSIKSFTNPSSVAFTITIHKSPRS